MLAQTEGALSGLGGRAETGTETLIVLPETVVHYTAWDDPLFQERFTQFARSEQIHWLIGLPRSAKVEHGSVGRDGPSPDSRERNSAFYIGRDGVRKAVYDKIYVIPVAESQFAPGATAGVIGVGGHLLGVGICSDVVVPDHALATMRAGAESLHYIASLGHIGGLTHLERAFVVFRAAEHGVLRHPDGDDRPDSCSGS